MLTVKPYRVYCICAYSFLFALRLGSVPNSLKLSPCRTGYLQMLSAHMRNGPPTHYCNEVLTHENWVLTLIHKSGNISLNSGPIWKIKKLAYPGEQARPAGWTRCNIVRPHVLLSISDGRTGFIWNTAAANRKVWSVPACRIQVCLVPFIQRLELLFIYS